MFVNFSNHPSDQWSDVQKEAAQKWGEIVDVPFPTVPAQVTETDIAKMADMYVREIIAYNPSAVMCQGEFTLAYSVIERLIKIGVLTVAACSDRIVKDYIEDGKQVKKTVFEFIKFREYK